MAHFRFTATVFLLLLFAITHAQENKYDMSRPLDLELTGVNKVLCMKNGNTMLFHFEPGKNITVKVFDSAHKQTASQSVSCRILDLFIIKDAIFKGLFEINGEAILFIDQEHLSKHGLVRLRFNGSKGTLTEEKLVGESQSMSKRTRFYVMNNRNEDKYAILFSTEVPQFLECKIYVAYYNRLHEQVKEVPIEVDRKRYDYLRVVNAESAAPGINITLSLAKLKENGTQSNLHDAAPTSDVMDHHLYIYFIPNGASAPLATAADVSPDVYPYYANYTYNPFAKTLNLLMLSYQEMITKIGLQWQPAALAVQLFLKLDENDLSIEHKWILNKIASNSAGGKKDTTKTFKGLPIKMFTNENGLTTIVSQSFECSFDVENRLRYGYYSDFGNIGITQVDDDGNEIWGTMLPFSQHFVSYQNYYLAYWLSKKWQSLILFDDLPEQVYNRQFLSVNCYARNRNLFIVYNGDSKDFGNSIEKPGGTVYGFNTTNACYYKLNAKKEITKHYVFGTPNRNEYKVSFVEGADYDENTGVYASLVQYKRGDNTYLKMGWSHLE